LSRRDFQSPAIKVLSVNQGEMSSKLGILA
jgi:hypothetical protein